MSTCDLKQQIKEKQPELKNLGDNKFNLDNLKVELKKGPTWEIIQSEDVDRGTPKMFTVVKNQGVDADPQMQVSRTSDVCGTVTLHEYFKGLNKAIKIRTPTQLKNVLGGHIKVNLGKEITEIMKDEMTISVALQVPGDGFSTTAEAKKFVFKGTFQCVVVISGNVTIDVAGKISTRDINELLKEQDEIEYIVRGIIDFKCPREQTITVN